MPRRDPTRRGSVLIEASTAGMLKAALLVAWVLSVRSCTTTVPSLRPSSTLPASSRRAAQPFDARYAGNKICQAGNRPTPCYRRTVPCHDAITVVVVEEVGEGLLPDQKLRVRPINLARCLRKRKLENPQFAGKKRPREGNCPQSASFCEQCL
jgi:hypothetical protein